MPTFTYVIETSIGPPTKGITQLLRSTIAEFVINLDSIINNEEPKKFRTWFGGVSVDDVLDLISADIIMSVNNRPTFIRKDL